MRFILGILIGIAAGAALGLVVAPQSGKETREALGKRVRRAEEDLPEVASDAPDAAFE